LIRNPATRETLGLAEDDSPKFAGIAVEISTKTANYTLTLFDSVILGDATSGSIIITLPLASAQKGRVYHVKKIDDSVNTVTIKGSGSETIDGDNTKVLSSQYLAFSVITDETQWWIQ